MDLYSLQQGRDNFFSGINMLHVYMVQNPKLEEEFVAKKSTLRETGRMPKEISESFGFLGECRRDVMENICELGITVKKGENVLGDSTMGVHLWRYADLCLHSFASNVYGNKGYLLIFKVSITVLGV